MSTDIAIIACILFIFWTIAFTLYWISDVVKWFRNKYKEWTDRWKQDAFNDGYDYTAGELLRGGDSAYLEMRSEGFDGPDQFDRGMQKALLDWELHKQGPLISTCPVCLTTYAVMK